MSIKPDTASKIFAVLMRLAAVFFLIMAIFSLLIYTGNWFVSKDDLNLDSTDVTGVLLPFALSALLFIGASRVSRKH